MFVANDDYYWPLVHLVDTVIKPFKVVIYRSLLIHSNQVEDFDSNHQFVGFPLTYQALGHMWHSVGYLSSIAVLVHVHTQPWRKGQSLKKFCPSRSLVPANILSIPMFCQFRSSVHIEVLSVQNNLEREKVNSAISIMETYLKSVHVLSWLAEETSQF